MSGSKRVSLGVTAAVLMLVAVASTAYAFRMIRQRAQLGPLKALRLERFEGGVRQLTDRMSADILLDPTSPHVWGEMGLALFANDAFEEAVVCFVHAETLAPDNYRWPYFQGLLLLTSDAEKGRAALLRAWNRNSKDQNLCATLADAQRRAGEEEAAAKTIQTAMALPGNKETRLALTAARIEADSQKFDKAIEWAEYALKNSGGSATQRESCRLLSELYEKTKQPAKAELERQRLRLYPKASSGSSAWNDPILASAFVYVRDPARMVNRLQMLSRRGEHGEALRLLEEMPASERADPLIVSTEAILRMSLGELDAAEELVQTASAKHPNNPPLLHARGILRMATGKFEEGAAAFAMAAKLDPMAHLARTSRGACLLELNKPTEALAEFDAALSIYPGSAEALAASAKVLEAMGKKEEAAKRLDQLRLLGVN